MTFPSDDLVARTIAASRPAVIDATHRVRSPKRSTRFRVTRLLIIAGVVIAALTAGSLIVTRLSQYDIDHGATCFEHASLDSLQVPIGGAGETTDDPLDPLRGCAFAWHLGDFQPGGPPDPTTADFPVPDLQVCTLPDGSAGVFPLEGHRADELCEFLGLPVWNPAPH